MSPIGMLDVLMSAAVYDVLQFVGWLVFVAGWLLLFILALGGWFDGPNFH